MDDAVGIEVLLRDFEAELAEAGAMLLEAQPDQLAERIAHACGIPVPRRG
jgi:hypothetical protein